jgi:hypothetical protein
MRVKVEHRLPEWPTGFLAYWVTHALDGFARGYLPFAAVSALPDLYSSSIRYRVDPLYGSGREVMANPWTVARRGYGDCNDLVLYRLIELLLQGESPELDHTRSVWSGNDVHVLIRRANGILEDPSLVLLARNGRFR